MRLAVILLVLGGGPALADCELHLLNSVPLAIDNNQLTVPASIKDGTHRFVIDTGAVANQVSLDGARAMGLGVTSYAGGDIQGAAAMAQAAGLGGGAPSMLEVFDAKGAGFKTLATVKDFGLGAMRIPAIDFIVSDLPPAGADGILATELFRRYDIDFNFAGGNFNMFDSDHCKARVIYWRTAAMAALPFTLRGQRVFANVTLDGKSVTALIDTGSPVSELRLPDAKTLFGLDEGAAHAFKTLSFGSVTVSDPKLVLARDIILRGADPNPHTGSRVVSDAQDQPALRIGMDVLRSLHLYIAFGERMLYVTPGREMAEDAPGALPRVTVLPFRP